MRPTVESANGTVTSETKFLTSDEEMTAHDSLTHNDDLEVEINSTSLGNFFSFHQRQYYPTMPPLITRMFQIKYSKPPSQYLKFIQSILNENNGRLMLF